MQLFRILLTLSLLVPAGRLAAFTINGPTSATIGQSCTYTVSATCDIAWVITGGVISSPASCNNSSSCTTTGNSITVIWNCVPGGTHRVDAEKVGGAFCFGTGQLNVSVTGVNLNAGTISGSTNVCPGTAYTYSVSPVQNATSYAWSLSSGGSITSGQGTNSVSVSWTNPGGNRTVTVTPYHHNCGSSTPSNKSVFVNTLLGSVGSIVGASTVCSGASAISYSITPVTGATNYAWTVPVGATIASGAGTNSITVNFGTSAQSGSVTVTPSNPCGTGTMRTKAVTVSPLPAAAGPIGGSLFACVAGGNTSYNVAPVANASTYVWTVTGGTIVSGQNTTAINVNWATAGTATITVKGSNSCGFGTISSFSVTVYPQAPAHADTLTYTHTHMSNQTQQTLILDHCPGGAPCGNRVLQKAELLIRLSTGEDHELGSTNFSCDLVAQTRAYNAYTGGTQLLSNLKPMHVGTDSPEQLYVLDVTSIYDQAQRFDIVLRDYTCTAIAQSSMKATATLRRTFLTPAAGQSVTLTPVNLNPSGTNKLTFSWTPSCAGFPTYQFQLLRLYNSDPAFAQNPQQIKARIDWNEALTIETTAGTSLTLSLTEGSGYYAWRVRPIGSTYPGGAANDLNWGAWSSTGALVQNAFVTISAALSPYCFFYNQFNDNLNWSYSRSFAENESALAGIDIRETMSYANGLLLEKQQQALLQSKGMVMTSQLLYDFSARQALTSQPAPVAQPYLQYVPQFVQRTPGVLYGAAHFDSDSTFRNPSPMSAGIPAVYYSNATPSGDSTIPAAEGYPYSRTLYSKDGFGRTVEQSMPGPLHRITNTSTPHTGRTLYAGVSEEELLRVLGDEAPRAATVRKTIMIDADNRTVISYVDGQGQRIATCMSAGADPAAFDSLNEPHGPVLAVNDLLDDATIIAPNGISATKPVAFVTPTTLKVYYSITPRSIQAACGTFCASCDYRVYFLLHNLSDPDAAGFPRKDSLIIPGGACPANVQSVSPYIQYANLPPGTYLVEKRLFTGNVNPNTGKTYLDEAAAAYRQQLAAEIDPYFTAIMHYVESGNLDSLNYYLDHMSGLPVDSAGNFFLLNTSCCSIAIPFEHCDEADCMPVDFEAMLTTRWSSDTELNFGTSISSYFSPAWAGGDAVQAGNFNALITNMLNDPLTPYSCEALQNCWKGIVEGYKTTRQQFIAQGKNYDPVAHFLSCTGRQLRGTSSTKNTTSYSSPGYLSHAHRAFKFNATANASCTTMVNGVSASLGMNLTYPYPDTARWHWQQLYDCANSYAPSGNIDVEAIADSIEADCRNSCEARYEGFVQAITQAYRNDPNYVIEGEGTPGQGQTLVTLQSIWCSAAQLVENCKSSCNLTVQYSSIPPPLHATNVGTPAQIDAVRNAMTSSFAVTLPNSNGLCPTGSWTSVSGQDSVLGLLIDYLNSKIDEFQATIGPGISYMNVYNLVDAFSHGLVTGNSCFTPSLTVPVSPYAQSYFSRRGCVLLYTFPNMTEINICSSLCSTMSCAPVCFKWLEPDPAPLDPDTLNLVSCAQQALSYIRDFILQQRQSCLDAAEQTFRANYVATCTNTAGLDSHRINYALDYFHYTLSYYDRAGRLIRTVPPAGVQFLDPSNAQVKNRQVHPAHTLVTEYEYNSLGQLIRKKSPDGGQKRIYYNLAGQQRFTQDAVQLPLNLYSYSKYDALGRKIESGQSSQSGAGGAFIAQTGNTAFPASGTQKTFVVYTVSTGVIYSAAKPQRFLNNRVSHTYTDKDGLSGTTTDQVHAYFSYDADGNTEWLIQELPELGKNYVLYDYDLFSGRIKKVIYNEGKPDQFMHRFRYDADYRVTAAETSRDGEIWDKDVSYSYYAHGPLKRELLGEDKIQGRDYVYTITGLLKSINHPALSTGADPGKDGGAGKVGKDAFGMMLAYYKGDFSRSGSPFNSEGTNSWFLGGTDLFGGQVTSWITQTVSSNTGLEYEERATGYTYRYDLLGRLKKAEFNMYSQDEFEAVSDYLSEYAYSANGNIQTLNRNGYSSSGLAMDRLSYNYYPGTNRLRYITDAAGVTSAYTGDLESQTNTNNYTYDNNGNLKTDAQNNSTVSWTIDDKIDQVLINPSGTVNDRTIAFTYDALGNRVIKKETATVGGALLGMTFYVHDANGMLMSVYKKTITGDTTKYALEETPLYGKERIGVQEKNILVKKLVNGSPVPLPGGTDTTLFTRNAGSKQYELSDHLDNVRAVVSDVKEPVNLNNLSLGFHAQLLMLANYDPFGMEMPGRMYSASTYRYGFNGKEKDDEWKGSGNSYDFGARIYDPRVGRWLSVDPLADQFPEESPYSFALNDPVVMIDPDGKRPYRKDHKTYKDVPLEGTQAKQVFDMLTATETYGKMYWIIENDPDCDVKLEIPGVPSYSVKSAVAYAYSSYNSWTSKRTFYIAIVPGVTIWDRGLYYSYYLGEHFYEYKLDPTYLAGLIFHEMVHSYHDYLSIEAEDAGYETLSKLYKEMGKEKGKLDHEYMATETIRKLKIQCMKEFDDLNGTSHDEEWYEAVAWDGLWYTDAWHALSPEEQEKIRVKFAEAKKQQQTTSIRVTTTISDYQLTKEEEAAAEAAKKKKKKKTKPAATGKQMLTMPEN